MIDLTEATFEEAVVAYPGLVVDFWAPWCGPCRAIAPVLENLDRDYAGRVTFAKVNVDEQPALAARYGVRSIPTLMVFKDGELTDRVVGAVPEVEIRKRLGVLG